MGQVFDQDGKVLAEAFGETKREVFYKQRLEADPIVEAAKHMSPMTTDRMLQFFTFAHLPSHLQAVSRPFCDLADQIVSTLPSNPERTVALRKLLEAKDCAVRALLYK